MFRERFYPFPIMLALALFISLPNTRNFSKPFAFYGMDGDSVRVENDDDNFQKARVDNVEEEENNEKWTKWMWKFFVWELWGIG